MNRAKLVLLVALCLLWSPPAWAGAAEEAARQLEFAHKELARGAAERAISSAESALRLDPRAYEALYVKGLAYEQLGQLELAESLLVACQELSRAAGPDPRIEADLERLRAARRAPHRSPRRGAEAGSIEATPVKPVDGGGEPDIDGQRERVQKALGAGQCVVAWASASEVTTRHPRLAEGWRLLGDAGRCAGRTRDAALAYRRYQDLGGTDPAVDQMLEGLHANLAAIDLDLQRQQGGPVPVARLALSDGEIVAPEVLADGTLRFLDLPSGAGLHLSVAGRGLQAMERDVVPLAPGEQRRIVLEPTYLGLGRVVLAKHDPALCRTTFVTADGEVTLAPGGSERITAGPVVAVVASDQGEVEVPFDLGASGEVDFDPLPWLPAALTVVGVPGGSQVRVFVDGVAGARVERDLVAPVDDGLLDEASGVRLARPFVVGSLIGGSGGLFVTHPVLGSGTGTLVLEPGSINATTFDWSHLPGIDGVRREYGVWSEGRELLLRQGRGAIAAPLSLAIGSAIASGLVFALAVDADHRLSESAAAAQQAQDAGDVNELARQADLNRTAARQQSSFVVAGGITSGVAVVGIVVSIGLGVRAKRRLADYGTWDPADLDAHE